MTFVNVPEELIKKADHALGFFTIYAEEPNQDVYFSKNISFSVTPILNDTAIYCVQNVFLKEAGSVIVGLDGSFLLSGHTRKGEKYLIDRWLSGDRTPESFLNIF